MVLADRQYVKGTVSLSLELNVLRNAVVQTNAVSEFHILGPATENAHFITVL